MRLKWKCLALVCVVTISLAGLAVRPSHAQDTTETIKRLRKERSKLLDDAAKVARAGWIVGGVEFETVVQCRRDADRARLELCEKTEERIAVLADSVKEADAVVEAAKARAKIDRNGQLQFMRARAFLLEVEIMLVQEKAKLTADSKK